MLLEWMLEHPREKDKKDEKEKTLASGVSPITMLKMAAAM